MKRFRLTFAQLTGVFLNSQQDPLFSFALFCENFVVNRKNLISSPTGHGTTAVLKENLAADIFI